MTDRHRSIVDLHLILHRTDPDRILLMRRANTGYGDGQLHLPSGHLEAGESAVDGVLREAHEEVGVVVEPSALQFVHVLHRSAENGPDRVGLFFRTTQWSGEPYNAEPGKCSELVWADPNRLPDDTIGYPAAAITCGYHGIPFSLYGWDSTAPGDIGQQHAAGAGSVLPMPALRR